MKRLGLILGLSWVLGSLSLFAQQDTFTQPNLFFVTNPMFKAEQTIQQYETYLQQRPLFYPQDTVYGLLYTGDQENPYWLSEDSLGKYIIVDFWVDQGLPLGVQYYVQPMQEAVLGFPMGIRRLVETIFKRPNWYYFSWVNKPPVYDQANKIQLFELIHQNYNRQTVFDGMTIQYSLASGIDKGSFFIDFSRGQGMYEAVLDLVKTRNVLNQQIQEAEARQLQLQNDVAPLTLDDFREWLKMREQSSAVVEKLEMQLFQQQETLKNIVNTLIKDIPKIHQSDLYELYSTDMAIVAQDDPKQKVQDLKHRETLSLKLKNTALTNQAQQQYEATARPMMSLQRQIVEQQQRVTQRQYAFMRQMHKFKELQTLEGKIKNWKTELEKLH